MKIKGKSQKFPKNFPKKSQQNIKKFPKNYQDFENTIQILTSHLEAENPFGLVYGSLCLVLS